jgi:hypothetical protein
VIVDAGLSNSMRTFSLNDVSRAEISQRVMDTVESTLDQRLQEKLAQLEQGEMFQKLVQQKFEESIRSRLEKEETLIQPEALSDSSSE